MSAYSTTSNTNIGDDNDNNNTAISGTIEKTPPILTSFALPLIQNPFIYRALDFETGDLSQWGIEYRCNESKDRDDLQVVRNSLVNPQSPGLFNDYVLNANVDDGDYIAGGERAELNLCERNSDYHNRYYFKRGDIVWYHWKTMLPQNFTTPGNDSKWWHVLAQWHIPVNVTNSLYGVPLAFNLDGENLNIRVIGGVYDNQSCSNHIEGKCGYIWIQPLQKGKWYTFDLIVKWSENQDGFVMGAVDNKLIDHYYRGVTLDPNDPQSQLLFFKQGIYRNQDINGTQTVYHDDTAIRGLRSFTAIP